MSEYLCGDRPVRFTEHGLITAEQAKEAARAILAKMRAEHQLSHLNISTDDEDGSDA